MHSQVSRKGCLFCSCMFLTPMSDFARDHLCENSVNFGLLPVTDHMVAPFVGTGQVQRIIAKATFQPQAAAFTALLHMCAKAKLWEKALEIFEAMKAHHSNVINTVHFSSLISACATAGRWEEAYRVSLRSLSHSGSCMDQCHGLLLQCCHPYCHAKQLVFPIHTLPNMPVGFCLLSVSVSLSHCILTQRHRPNHHPIYNAQTHLLRQYRAAYVCNMRTADHCVGKNPSLSSMVNMISPSSVQVFQEMKAMSTRDPRCKPNVITYSALMTACCAGGQPEKAHEVFQEMQAAGIKPDQISYSTLIAGNDPHVLSSVHPVRGRNLVSAWLC
jgi:pentatricopeptide repeat protein